MDTNERDLTVDLQALGEVWQRLGHVHDTLHAVLTDAQTLRHQPLPLGTSSQAKDLNRKFANRAETLNVQLAEALSRMSTLATAVDNTTRRYRTQDGDVATTFRAL